MSAELADPTALQTSREIGVLIEEAQKKLADARLATPSTATSQTMAFMDALSAHLEEVASIVHANVDDTLGALVVRRPKRAG